MDNAVTQVRPRPATLARELELGQPIGGGSSGTICQSFNPLARKNCAVKVIHHDIPVNVVTRGRLEHAARRVSALALPQIVRTFRVDAADGQTKIVSELVEGVSLAQYSAEHGALPRPQAIALIRELGVALARAHEAKVPHLRLHPGNVLLVSDGRALRPRICDFGIQAIYPPPEDFPKNIERAAWIPAFVAPEVLRGESGDVRSDVYSIAALAYLLLTGHPPFKGPSYAATLDAALTASPTSPEQYAALNQGLVQSLLRALEREPKQRPPSVEAWLAGIEPGGRTTGKFRAVTKPGSRSLSQTDHVAVAAPVLPATKSKAKWWIAGAVAALLAVGLGGFALLSSDEEPEESPAAIKARKKRRAALRRMRQRRKRARKPYTKRARKITPRKVSPIKPGTKLAVKPDAPPPSKAPAKSKKGIVKRRNFRIASPKKTVENDPAKAGTLVIGAPPGTRILLDGRDVGEGPLRTLRRIPSGAHSIELQKDGETVASRRLYLMPGRRLRVNLKPK